MSEDRELLERAERHFPPPEGAFRALVRRRARHERNRRLASAGLAITLAVAALWVAAHGFLGVGAGHQPKPGSERNGRLAPETVPGLPFTWLGTVGPVNSSPVVAGGRVYFGSSNGDVYAFPVRCQTGGKTCSPLWIGHTSGLDNGVPTVAGGTVYVGSNDGRLYAFPTSCGSAGGTCQPRWTFATGTSLGYTSPVLVGDAIYMATDRLWSIDASTGALRWSAPIEIPHSPVGSWYATPALSGDTLILSDKDLVAAFSLTCGEQGGSCSPLWIAHHPLSVMAQPVVADGVVYQSAGANVYAYPVSCGTGGETCAPLWVGHAPNTTNGPPTVADGLVYVGSKDGSFSAFAVGCGSGGSECRPVATNSAVSCQDCYYSTILVASGVLYDVTDEVVAYPESCALEATCQRLFRAGPYYANAGAAVTDDAVYVATNALGGHLYGFELPRASAAKAARAPAGVGTTAIAIVVYVLLAAWVARAVLRRRRRTRLA